VSEPSEKAKGIVLDMLHGLCDAGAIDGYVDEMVSEERERVLACGRYASDWKEWTRMIEDGDWPEEGKN
jgi:hypothetical protein